MTLQTTSWLNLLPFTIGCLLILGFIGYAAYRGPAHMKRFPLHYLAGFALCLILGIYFIRTAAKPTTIADTELGKNVTLYDKTQNLDEFLTLDLMTTKSSKRLPRTFQMTSSNVYGRPTTSPKLPSRAHVQASLSTLTSARKTSPKSNPIVRPVKPRRVLSQV